MALSFATLNVRGLNSKRKQYQLQRLLGDGQPDFFAIQETKMADDDGIAEALRPFLFWYEACVSHAVGFSAGCFLFIKKSVNVSNMQVVTDERGRFICCDFQILDVQWRVLCVYAPNKVREREQFFQFLRSYLECDKVVVLMGDFNCVCDESDRSSGKVDIDSSASVLKDITEGNGLDDVGALLAGKTAFRYTHFQASSHARLDRIYISSDIIRQVHGYDVKPVFFTDHCLVTVKVGEKRTAHSKFNWNLWKMNRTLLKDEQFVATVTELLKNVSKKDNNIGEAWEIFKEDIKMAAIQHSSRIKHQRRAHEKHLQRNLKALLQAESENPGAGSSDIRYIKSELDNLYKDQYRGAVVRSRSEKFLLGEQPTKRALADEKRYALSKEIYEIEYKGTISNDKDVIQNAFVEYFEQLFGDKPTPVGFSKLSDYISLMPQLDDDVKTWLEGDITAGEIEHAIDSLARQKTPGPDGLCAEFYQMFKKSICPLLQQIFHEAYEKQRVPRSFLEAHTILIAKSEDVVKRRSVKGYRPITLCNTDYKIFTKILTRRLQNVISTLVGDHQTCGIKGRSIQTNIHVARSILENTMDDNQVAMIQLDFEKAFDRVRHDVLERILSHVNVGDIILKGFCMAYSGCKTRLVINNSVSKSILVLSSVRQGCPLSPLLFSLYLEPYCLKVEAAKGIRGYRLNTVEVKVSAYADDVAVFCTDKRSVTETVAVTKEFCDATGAAVNWEKCCGYWHGGWASKPSSYAGISWSNTPCTYLGVPLQHYRVSTQYWNEIAADLRKKATSWANRDLSMFARATVCNIFLVAKLWYVLQVLACSRTNVQKFHRVFATFIWGSSWERMRRDNLFRRVKSGGLGLTHLFVRQLVSRFCFLRDQNHPFLRSVIQVRLANILTTVLVTSDNTVPRTLFGFLKEVKDATLFLQARFSMEYLGNVSKKKLTRDLVEILFPVPLYRSFYSQCPGQDVLCRVKKMCVPPVVKSFFFKLHSNTLPVKPWLKEKGIFVPWSVDCLLCKKPETIEHVFIYCWDAVFFWDVLQRTLKKDLTITSETIRYLPVEKCEEVPYDLFIVLGLFSVWKTRMEFRHADPHIKSVRSHFIDVVAQVESVYCRSAENAPDWAHVFTAIKNMKEF